MLATALALLAAPAAGDAPTLTVTDLAFGSSAPSAAPPSEYLGLVPGHLVRFRVAGAAPGEVAVLAASSGLAAVPLPLGDGTALLLAPADLFVVGAKLVGGAGEASFETLVPDGLPIGEQLATQGATFDPVGLQLELTQNALEHAVTDLALDVVSTFTNTGYPVGPLALQDGDGFALLLNDPVAWQAFWDLHTWGFGGAAPAVDFSTRVVIVALAGEFSTGGFGLAVDSVGPAPAGGLQVQQTLTTPGTGCPVTQAFTQPGQIVTVDRVAGAPPIAAVTAVLTSVQPGAPCQ